MKTKPRREIVSPARRAAFDILHRVETEGAFASVLIARLDESGLSREDRALAQEIVLGVLRWRRLLDYLIERCSKRSVERLDIPVLIALRMGVYQLRYLSRVPHSAAVNESVNLVKRARVSSAAGFVNAVLRSAAKSIDARSEELHEGSDDLLERDSIDVSHPRWMLKRWRAQLGDDEARALALANNRPATVAFRVNTLKGAVADALARLAREGVTVRESNISPDALVVTSGPALAIAQAAEQGLIYIQDEASQLVASLLEAHPGHLVLDLCAAPGSKSSQIAALTNDRASIIACDLYPRRLITLREACDRLGISSVFPVAFDATATLPFVEELPGFDRVLVDAPCSGTGTLRGNPEIKWRLSIPNITELAELQLTLLRNAASAARAGGRLLYSTCSLEPEENENVIERFIASTGSFRIVRPHAPPSLITRNGFVRTFPHRDGSDGFFAAVLEKIGQ